MVNSRRRSSRAASAGFTLVELLVVLAILTLLAGLVGPRVLGQLGGAKSKTAAVQIADIDKALEIFKLDVGRFPRPRKAWRRSPSVRPRSARAGPGPTSRERLPADPWGRPYRYQGPGPTAPSKSSRSGRTARPAGRAKMPTSATRVRAC